MAEDYEAIVASNWYTNFGPYEQRLSNRTAEYVGKDIFATTVANCTLGLDIAINLLFDKKCKKVIMPSFTFAAGAEMLISSGFTPLFIDIEPITLQPSIKQARKTLEVSGKDVAGILLCNIFGVGNREIASWEKLAKEYKIPLLIDSAAGFGSRYDEEEIIGGRGDCEVFSLHATKPFAVGEGGIITSKNGDLIAKLRSMQNFGFESDRLVHRIGTNAKLQEFNCAIGLRQLGRLQDRIKWRQTILSWYMDELKPAGYVFQDNALQSTVAFATVVAPNPASLPKITATLSENGVETHKYYAPALHQQNVIDAKCERAAGGLPVTESIVKAVISLPILEDMTQEEVKYICGLILKVA